MERSEQVGDLMAALAKAQSEFTYAAKDSKNPAFNSSYADLASVIQAVRPALSKNGIAFLQCDDSDVERQTASVTTSLHLGDQWIGMTAEAPAVGMKGFNVQSLGACWTYLRRYTLQALCGLASDDDDGNSLAVDNKPAAKKQAAAKSAPAEAATGIRSQFFSKAKEYGWGLGDIKEYLRISYPDASSTSDLTEDQLSAALNIMAQKKPEAVLQAEAAAA